MGRWEPDAQGRLQEAALELFVEQGYAATTVAGIAERAGLTKRTFFRYFADKREVLFDGGETLRHQLVTEVERAPADLAPLDVVARAVETAGAFFGARREWAVRRQGVIEAEPELQERELIKLARLGEALATALVERGVSSQVAALAGEMGMALLRAAFARWVDEDGRPAFDALVRESLVQLRGVTRTTTTA